MPAPQILIIAGHDPSGAGIHADIETCAAHRCQAISAITALTAQNTYAVTALNPTPASVLSSQLASILEEDYDIAACKIGLVCTAEQVELINRFLEELISESSQTIPIVIDPVIQSTSGRELMPSLAYERYETELLPHATLMTPNQLEAQTLSSNTSIEDSGKALCERYNSDVLITGTDAKTNPIEHHLFESS